MNAKRIIEKEPKKTDIPPDPEELKDEIPVELFNSSVFDTPVNFTHSAVHVATNIYIRGKSRSLNPFQILWFNGGLRLRRYIDPLYDSST